MYYIYLIVNKVNGKTYVGQRKSSKEWYEDKYMGSGKLLKKAKQKYGIENFEKFLIQYCSSKDEVNEAERFWIAEYRRRGKAEYNIADGGDGGSTTKGMRHSEEWNKKVSEAQKGKHLSEETKRKISEAARNRTDEWRKKSSESHKGQKAWNKGKKMSEEYCKKLSEVHKGQIPWNKGKKLGPTGTHWYNNGEINVKAKECPEGFVKGRLHIHH